MGRLLGCWLILMGLCWQAARGDGGEPLDQWINEADTGAFLMRDASGGWTPALLLDTEVDIRVSGPVARVSLVQRFRNHGGEFSEGVYVFPMPENSAVHGMVLGIGERRIVGDIREKEQAKKIYQQAKRDGRRAGIVEQRRANMFLTKVANIGAGEQVTVTLHYTELLVPDGQRFSLRFPLTMTPRYSPNAEWQDEESRAPVTVAEQQPVEGLIHPDHALPENSHRVQISAYVDAGQEVSDLASSSHQIRHQFDGRGYRVVLPAESVPMDQDFVLSWRLRGGAGSRASLFTETLNNEHYAVLMLNPAEQPAKGNRMPREVILIIDTSGSMSGERIRQAQKSLVYALQQLQPEDRFNVLEFNSRYRLLYRQMMPASFANIEDASDWVNDLVADGGTEMLPVIEDALSLPTDPAYLRQVIFVTDGSVSNEQAVLQMIQRRLHRARLFTVGIGAAPNNYLLSKAAEIGRGTFTYIGSASEVSTHMAALFDKLEKPVLTDLRIDWPEGVEAEAWPEKLPDLYVGQPLVVAMKLNRLPDAVTIRGRSPEPWQQHMTVPDGQHHPGVATLWARSKIDSLMNRIIAGEREENIRPQVLDVALEHRLISRYTSFVAVEENPVRAPDAPLLTQELGNRNPVDHVYPQTSLGLMQLWLISALCLLLAVLCWLMSLPPEQREA
jgi:Ca-activated chloride channel family protein